MSLTASVIGLLLILIRFIRYIPRFCIYTLWGLIFIRLIFPFFLSSEVSLLNLGRNYIKKILVVPVPISVPVSIPAKGNINFSASNSIGVAQEYFPVTYKSDHIEKLFRTSSLVWIIGAAIAVFILIILYILSTTQLSNSIHIKDNIYVNDLVQAPMTFGILNQKIILSPRFKEDLEQLKYVLLHENVHIKRHDNLFRLMGILTACIHWFNPLVWIFLILFLKDMELSCDSRAIRLLTKDERKSYAQALVNMGTGQKVFMSTSFNKNNIRGRVLNVLNYKKLTATAFVLSLIFIVLATAVIFTNPVK